MEMAGPEPLVWSGNGADVVLHVLQHLGHRHEQGKRCEIVGKTVTCAGRRTRDGNTHGNTAEPKLDANLRCPAARWRHHAARAADEQWRRGSISAKGYPNIYRMKVVCELGALLWTFNVNMFMRAESQQVRAVSIFRDATV